MHLTFVCILCNQIMYIHIGNPHSLISLFPKDFIGRQKPLTIREFSSPPQTIIELSKMYESWERKVRKDRKEVNQRNPASPRISPRGFKLHRERKDTGILSLNWRGGSRSQLEFVRPRPRREDSAQGPSSRTALKVCWGCRWSWSCIA